MEHAELYQLRETYNRERILLCFNGPFRQGLIEELGNAVKRYLQSEVSPPAEVMDVFGVYVEVAQNIRLYAQSQGYDEADASATVVISRDREGHYVVAAGNIVEPHDGVALQQQVQRLAAMDAASLKAEYKARLRQPRNGDGAGLGLIDMARKGLHGMSCSLHPAMPGPRFFFSLRVVL